MQLLPQWLTRPNKQALRERSRLQEKILNKHIDCYVRPENWENLQAPAVSPEVWKVFPLAARKADLNMVTMQTATLKAAAQSTQRARSFADSSVGKTMTKNNTDTLALLGHASKEPSMW